MIAILPFLRERPKLRTWAALGGASLATFWVTDPVGYVAIDAIAAAIVIARPAGVAQKAIGIMFALMMVFDLVYSLTPRANPELFYNALIVLGWVQWAILAGWTAGDYLGRFVRWNSAGDDPSLAVRKPVR